MLPEIKATSITIEDEEENKRQRPQLPELHIKSARYESKKRAEVKEEKGTKKLITKYKLEVTSQGEQVAVWNIYIRYNELDDLFKELKSKCNKDDIKNLHLTSQRLKLFKTKNQRQEAVRRFIEVLSGSENLLSQPMVEEFFKKDAFNIHWENEMVENAEEEDEEEEETNEQ